MREAGQAVVEVMNIMYGDAVPDAHFAYQRLLLSAAEEQSLLGHMLRFLLNFQRAGLHEIPKNHQCVHLAQR